MNIFIVGFPDHFKRKELIDLFALHGEGSSAKVITNLETGHSRCFGFVEMPNDEEAKKAIKSLHETMVEDRKISVMQARENKR